VPLRSWLTATPGRVALGAVVAAAAWALGLLAGSATASGSSCAICFDGVAAASPLTASPTTAAVTVSSVPDEVSEISGSWVLTANVSRADGSCGDLGSYSRTVEIDQERESLSISGLGDPGSVWEGEISGDVVRFGGSRSESGGLTTSRFLLELGLGADTMVGTEDWIWEGADSQGNDLFCPDGHSTVTAERVG
jgi:hypothetical protein